ncbi:DUF262 domain-containing protein [Persephonella sp.]
MPNEKNNSNFEEKTFIPLIKEHKIEIPELQRDYAQGREKEKYKAETFLDYLLDGIENNIEKNLDFIYGDLEEDIFIPIDGQQRLTTLFLIYFYLSLKNGEYKEELKNFSYKLRPSSKDFFESITKRDNFEKLKNKIKEKSIKEAITNSNWFFKSWLFDPTVKSVLNMLELIEEKIKDKELDTRGIENIKFQFLPLKNFSLTDEIYVKMNARGKPLTPFENFKAELEANFFKKDLELQKKFDNAYLDIFWTIVKDILETPILADKLFYRFLYNLFLSYYLLLNKKRLKKRLEEKDFNLNEFIKENPYLRFCNDKGKFCINEEYKEFFQDYIVKFLDKIIYGNIKTDENFRKFFKEILLKEPTGEKKGLLEEELTILTFPERAKFFAYFLYIVRGENDKHFLRVLNNLINNTRIEETDQIINALENIFNFFENVKEKETLKYITEKETNFIKFFRNEQIKEEVRKAKLLLEDNTWEEAIIEAERHWYLEGKIDFLLDFSQKDKGKENIETFKKYYCKFNALWKFAQESTENQQKIYASLLTIGDYLPTVGDNKRTLCSFDKNIRSKLDGWYKVFEDKEKKEIFKEFLDKIYVKNVKKSLIKLLFRHEFDCKDWKSYLIEVLKIDKEFLNFFQSNHLYLHFKGSGKDKIIYILRKTDMRSLHKELYTWYLFIKEFGLKPKKERIKKLEGKKTYAPFELSYYELKSGRYDPEIVLANLEMEKGKFLDLCISFTSNDEEKKGFWEISVWLHNEDGNKLIINRNKKIKKVLKNKNIGFSNEKYIKDGYLTFKKTFELCEEEKLLKKIKSLSKKLEKKFKNA